MVLIVVLIAPSIDRLAIFICTAKALKGKVSPSIDFSTRRRPGALFTRGGLAHSFAPHPFGRLPFFQPGADT